MGYLNQSFRVNASALRNWRLRLGLTQEQAGNMAGYSDRLIRKAERGGPINYQTLADLIHLYSEIESVAKPKITNFIQHLDEKQIDQICRRWFETAFNNRDLSIIDELFSPEITLFSEGQVRKGRNIIHERLGTLLQAFDPITITVEKTVVSGDEATIYWHSRKKHVGTFLEIEPTQRWVEIKGSSYVVIRNGQFVEARDHWDIEDCIRQLTGQQSRTF